MNVETSIGENYHFELHDALLVYQGRGTSFVTRHEVTLSKSAPPVLGPALPLTVSFIESLVRSVGGNVKPEILPENVVAKGDRMIAWWTPQRRRAMFYENSEGEAKHLNGKVFPQPPLVWQVWEGSALAMLSRLFRHGKLKHHGAFFNAATGHMSAISIDPDLWRRTRRRSLQCARNATKR